MVGLASVAYLLVDPAPVTFDADAVLLLDALRRFRLSVMAHPGWVPEQHIADLRAAGYDQPHALVVLRVLAQTTLSN